MIIGEDFAFRDKLVKDEKETVPIELLTGPYQGVIIRYTKVAILENQNNTATLKFEYEFLKLNKFKEDKLRQDKMFEKHIGLVLNTMILESLEGKRPNEHGTTDTQKSIEE